MDVPDSHVAAAMVLSFRKLRHDLALEPEVGSSDAGHRPRRVGGTEEAQPYATAPIAVVELRVTRTPLRDAQAHGAPRDAT